MLTENSVQNRTADGTSAAYATPLMVEELPLKALREVLRPEVDFRGYSAPRRKHMAELAVEQILKSIARGIISLGRWEQLCIEASLKSLRQGQYDQARISAVEALRVLEERSIELGHAQPRSLEELSDEFRLVRARPVLEP